MQLNISNRVSLFLWTVLLTCSGFLISHQLIYYLLILPQTLGGNIIRSFWWPLSHVPILIACIYLGSRIRSFPELTVATAGSFLATIFIFLDVWHGVADQSIYPSGKTTLIRRMRKASEERGPGSK